MRPQWFDSKDIPYDKMWLDDKYWMPLLLEGKLFKGYYHFKTINELVKYEIQPFENYE